MLLQAENGEAAESDKKVAQRGFVRSDSFMAALGPTLVRQPLSQQTGSRDAAFHLSPHAATHPVCTACPYHSKRAWIMSAGCRHLVIPGFVPPLNIARPHNVPAGVRVCAAGAEDGAAGLPRLAAAVHSESLRLDPISMLG